MSCEKSDDPNMHKVYYNSQPGYGTGGNPNPNGVATSGGSATTSGTTSGTTSTTGTTTCTSTLNGAAAAATSSGNTIIVAAGGGSPFVNLNFPGTSAPASGTYAITIGSPTGMQCTFQDAGNSASAGSVTITTGAPNKVTFSGISCGTATYTGTGCY